MSDPEKGPPSQRSNSSFTDAVTLNEDAQIEQSIQSTRIEDLEKNVIMDHEKGPRTSTGRGPQASYFEDPVAQSPGMLQVQTVSAGPPGPVVVPRPERRGWFGSWVLIPEVEEPKDYERGTKWWITFIISFAGIAAPFGSAIIFRKD